VILNNVEPVVFSGHICQHFAKSLRKLVIAGANCLYLLLVAVVVGLVVVRNLHY